jgi:hypothetical protein
LQAGRGGNEHAPRVDGRNGPLEPAPATRSSARRERSPTWTAAKRFGRTT